MPDMETSTFIAVAPPRDLLALLTSIFTISTGLILAMGAVYAYFLQRARYLRDIEPDLRFMNEFRVREQYGDSISIDFEVTNESSNTGEMVRVSAVVDEIDDDGSFTTLEPRLPIFADKHSRRLLPRRSMTDHFVFLSSKKSGAYRAKFDLTYVSPREWIVFLVKPWPPFRMKYWRTASLSWTLETAQNGRLNDPAVFVRLAE